MPFRNNLLIFAALVLLSALAWAMTVYQADGMGWGMFTCSMTMGAPFSISNAILYIVLWGVMMVAMMLPALTPMVEIFQTMARRRQEQLLPFTPVWVFIAGYFVLWTLTGSVGYAADLAIQSLPAQFPALRTYGMAIGGVTLIVAGIYQLTPLKYLCLSQCRSPMGFLMSSWRDGHWGAFRMGVDHGLYCLGCCWSLMTVLFVVGSMNLVWMGILSAMIFVEKIVPQGMAIGKATGIALIVLGSALCVGGGPFEARWRFL
jgi:predicted metal-binding membrane protein